MITLDLSILNQKGTPMFNSDLTANRPAAGIAGRIFIATDSPYGIFRDTGSAWDQVAGSGGGGGNTIYTANDTLTSNRVVSSGGFGLSFTSTTYIGTAAIGGGGSGQLIVGSSNADNGIQIFGANSPSLRIDNAQSGGSQRFVIGAATATNNFIQGSTSGQFCISTASSGAILFGMWQTINASEVMRISTASNLLLGSTTDTGQKLQVTGTSLFNDNLTVSKNQNFPTTINISNTNNNALSESNLIFTSNSGQASTGKYSSSRSYKIISGGDGYIYNSSGDYAFINDVGGGRIKFAAGASSTAQMTLTSGGNLLLSSTTDTGEKLQVTGSWRINGQSAATAGGSAGLHLIVNVDGTNYKIALLNA